MKPLILVNKVVNNVVLIIEVNDIVILLKFSDKSLIEISTANENVELS